MNKLITTKQAAEQVGVDPHTIMLRIWNKKLPATKMGHQWLIDQADFQKLIETEKFYSAVTGLSVDERFWKHVDIGTPDSCWPWRKAIDHNGNPIFGVSTGKSIPARRFAYENKIGPIPEGCVVIPSCANNICCNPSHLILNTTKQLRGSLVKPVHERFWSKVRIGTESECWNWQAGTNDGGYGIFAEITGSAEPAHRWAYRFANGEFRTDVDVLHTCDNRLCCNPNHLYLGTDLENVKDRVGKNRSSRKYFPPKLSEADVLEIRNLSALGVKQRDIAVKFHTTPHYISDIICGRTWKHL
jgi:excisionase family DNA binding protein